MGCWHGKGVRCVGVWLPCCCAMPGSNAWWMLVATEGEGMLLSPGAQPSRPTGLLGLEPLHCGRCGPCRGAAAALKHSLARQLHTSNSDETTSWA